MRPANLDPDRLPSARAAVDQQVNRYEIAPLDQPTAADLMARNNRISAEVQQRLDKRPARSVRRDGVHRGHSGVSILDTSA